MANKVMRVQIGHYARTRGATGTQSGTYGWTEQQMNLELSKRIVEAAKKVSGLDVETVGADDKPGGNPDIFVSLHMDGNDSTSPSGGSFGHNSTSNSKKFVAIMKRRYQALGLPSVLRGDNYTTGLSRYYGYKSAYAGWGSGPKIVFENGFLTNAKDASWAKDNQTRVAEMIVASAAEYLGLGVVTALPKAVTVTPHVSDWYKIIAKATGRVPSSAVQMLQEELFDWGYATHIDGLIGPNTEKAFQRWAYDHLQGTTSVETSGKRPGPGAWAKLLGDVTPKIDKSGADAAVVVEEPEEKEELVFKATVFALEQDLEQETAINERLSAVLSQIASIAQGAVG